MACKDSSEGRPTRCVGAAVSRSSGGSAQAPSPRSSAGCCAGRRAGSAALRGRTGGASRPASGDSGRIGMASAAASAARSMGPKGISGSWRRNMWPVRVLKRAARRAKRWVFLGSASSAGRSFSAPARAASKAAWLAPMAARPAPRHSPKVRPQPMKPAPTAPKTKPALPSNAP